MKAKGYSLSPTSGSKILKKNKPVKSSWQELVFQYPCSIFSNCDFKSSVKSCKLGKCLWEFYFLKTSQCEVSWKWISHLKVMRALSLDKFIGLKMSLMIIMASAITEFAETKKGGSCFSYFFFFQQKNCVCSIIWQHLPPHSFLREYWKPDHFKLAYSGTGKV